MIKNITMLICAVATLAMSMTANAQQQTAGRQWAAHELTSIDQVNHSSFDQLLKKYVDTNGKVNYQAWHQSAADRAALT